MLGNGLVTQKAFDPYTGRLTGICTGASPVAADGSITWRHHIRAAGHTVAIHTRSNDGTRTTVYPHRDHLGSIAALSDEDGDITARMSYGAFGKRRDPQAWSGPAANPAPGTTDRGYTGHQMLDGTGLIHMNGRVYDPGMGRFVSPDPLVQFPHNSQSYNRYSYVRNNPLSVSDPSGFLENQDDDNCGPDLNCDGEVSENEKEWAEKRCERMTPGHPDCGTVSNGDGTYVTMPLSEVDGYIYAQRIIRSGFGLGVSAGLDFNDFSGSLNLGWAEEAYAGFTGAAEDSTLGWIKMANVLPENMPLTPGMMNFVSMQDGAVFMGHLSALATSGAIGETAMTLASGGVLSIPKYGQYAFQILTYGDSINSIIENKSSIHKALESGKLSFQLGIDVGTIAMPKSIGSVLGLYNDLFYKSLENQIDEDNKEVGNE